jgi:hypothetical protein
MRSRLACVLIVLGFVACGGEGSPPAQDTGVAAAAAAAPREVRFVASDFAFEGPESFEAGMITFVLENTSETWHHLQLVRLPEGLSFTEFQERLAGMRPGQPIPEWFVEVGGVNPPPPGGSARATHLVEAGEYAVLCAVDTPDHIPHVMKGMIRPLTVTPSASPPAPLPASDLTLTLVDYAFSFSAPPTRGSHVIRVENAATQSHEIALFRLLPGKTVDDFMAWGATYEGPPPAEILGGVPAFRPGIVATMDVDLTPGDYLAVCFVPDANDGAPHIAHGMVLPFAIS